MVSSQYVKYRAVDEGHGVDIIAHSPMCPMQKHNISSHSTQSQPMLMTADGFFSGRNMCAFVCEGIIAPCCCAKTHGAGEIGSDAADDLKQDGEAENSEEVSWLVRPSLYDGHLL